MADSNRHRNYCFTIFGYDEAYEQRLKEFDCKYLVFGREICPDTQKLHLQGYIELTNAKTVRAFQKKLGNIKFHCKPRIATSDKASAYCKKDEDYFEKGKISRQGTRNDLTSVRESIQRGASMRDIIEVSSNYQCLRMAEKVFTYYEKPRNFPTEVLWFWGPTGTGKTRTAYASSTDPYTANLTAQWWDGYDAHEHVIIDDFRSTFCNFPQLLQYLDRYACRIPFKGGFRQLLAKQIIVTCPTHPNDSFPGSGENIDQLLRRIKTIVYFPPKLDLSHELDLIEDLPHDAVRPPSFSA